MTLLYLVGSQGIGAAATPPAEPAKVKLSLSPATVAPGAEAELVVELLPIEGVKINRYPQIKVRVAAQGGIVEESQVLQGDPKPPAHEQLDRNYFERLDPLRLKLQVDRNATHGRHELTGDVTYAYCITGMCSRVKVPIKFPVEVAGP